MNDRSERPSMRDARGSPRRPSRYAALFAALSVFCSISYGELTMNVLPNGIRLIVKRNPSNRILAMQCYFRAGSYYERTEESGITNLLCETMLKGTKNRTALEIAETMEAIGGEIDASASEDFVVVSTISTVEDLDTALDVLRDVIVNPTFPPDELEKEREAVLAAIRQQEDHSFSFAYKQFRALLYEGHPYALPVIGTTETVRAITRRQIVELHRGQFAADNMLAVVVGDVHPDTIARKMARAFADMPLHHEEKIHVSKQFRPRYRTRTFTKEVEQAFIILGFITDRARSEDYVPLKVACAVLGTGASVSARLFVRLRDRLGLAYAVGCQMRGAWDKSHFYAYIGTSPETVETARDKLLEEIRLLAVEPVPPAELERAKNHLIGQFRIAHQRNSAQAEFLGIYEMLGLEARFDEVYCDLIKQVTAEQVQAVAAKYFTAPTLVILRPPAKAK
ncbi:MAG: insulinase family protein [Candidatus Sumerlaeia bacterium]|nr:insulinase family protein [Candidatus Sumerlaeia bacterium]